MPARCRTVGAPSAPERRASHTMRRLLTSGALLTLLAGAVLAGQQQGTSDSQPQRPTFRAQIDYVEVSAIVSDDDGNLVNDLQASDFQVFENGELQTISVFTPVHIPIE